MIRFVLDTDTLTLYQLGNANVIGRVRAAQPDTIAVTVVTVEEQLGGWYTKLRRVKKPEEAVKVLRSPCRQHSIIEPHADSLLH